MEKLVEKYLSDTITEAEKLVLFQQIESDEELKDEFATLQNMMALSRLAIETTPASHTEVKYKEFKQRTRKSKNRRIIRSCIKYAVAAVLISCVWIGIQNFVFLPGTEDCIEVQAPTGQRFFVTFPDGSEAWISSRSKLKIHPEKGKKERKVELEGEGYFHIAKNPDKPFIVQTADYSIQVLGTRFNVSAYPESSSFETDLLEGAIYLFSNQNKKEGIYLKPNEKVYLENGQLIKTPAIPDEYDYLQSGIYRMDDIPFEILLQRLEVWYDVKLTVKRPEIFDFIFTGKLRLNDDIKHILMALKEVNEFQFTIRNEHEIELY